MYRTYSVNDMPQPIVRRDNGERIPKRKNEEQREEEREERVEQCVEREERREEYHAERGGEDERGIGRGEPCEIQSCEPVCETLCEPESSSDKGGGLLANLKLDDIIIFVVIIILLADDCDDKLLILALGFILFTDFFNF